jgi:hypothetical protein
MRTPCSRRALAPLAVTAILLVSACSAGFESPPPDLEDADLAGTWVTHYTRHTTDELVLRFDGTFKQRYADSSEPYVFETPWNGWWLARLPNGLIRVHLDGARYFLASPEIVSLGLYDPFAREFVHPVRELILSVRVESDGELILHHMWTSGDGGFALIGGDKEVFHRIKGP